MPNERAPSTLEEALAVIGQLQQRLEEVLAHNRRLQAEVQELRARLGQNSRNSSRPPSSDPPGTRGGPSKSRSARKQGAQPGHPEHHRPLLPASEVDDIRDHWPELCGGCGGTLVRDICAESGQALRHQVAELPPVKAYVTEHRLHQVRCQGCGASTCAQLPQGIPAQAFGPRAQATVATLSGRYHLTRREVQALCEDVLGLDVSVGSVQGICERVSAATEAPVNEVADAIRQQPVAHADETGWANAGKRRWLWTVVTGVATVFQISPHRSAAVIRGLLEPDFHGVLVSDRYSAYTWYPRDRQVCLAHLRRDFQGLVDRGTGGCRLGKRAAALIDSVFTAWHRYRAGEIDRTGLQGALDPIQEELVTVLERGIRHKDRKTAGLCDKVLDVWPWLWTFAEVPGVEPTNNVAERALRPAVLWRKGSFGNQSAAGERFVERMLTVAATCRQGGRSMLDYLTDAMGAYTLRQPIPSLLFTPASP